MIRRAAYQEVVVVVHAADHPFLPFPPAPSPSPSSFSAPPAYAQHAQQTRQYPFSSVRPWDNTYTSTEHNNNESNTFKVPIHLIKRSRAVLFKDLERLIAPSSTATCGTSGGLVQAIRTQRGDIIYRRHGHDPDDHESSNNISVNNQNFTDNRTNSCSNSNINKHDNSITADRVDAAAGAARSSHRPSDSSLPSVSVALPSSSSFLRTNNTIMPTSTTPPSSSSTSSMSISHKPQQQQPTFIPIHEDMEGCIWYLYPSSSPSPSSSSSRSSSTNNHPSTTTTTATPITNGKDEHRLVGRPDTTNRSQPCSSSSSFASASASSPFSVVEDSKKELFSLLDTSMAGNAAAFDSPIIQGGDQATLSQCRRRQEQQEERQENYRPERGGGGGGGERMMSTRTTTVMQGFDDEEGCSRTLSQGLGHAGPSDDADKERYAAEGMERRGGWEREEEERQTRTTKLGGRISEGQSSPLAGSRSKTERGSTTQASSIYPLSSLSIRTSTCQTLLATTPNIDRQRQQRLRQEEIENEEEQEQEQRRLYDKKESNDIPPTSSLSLSPQHSRSYSDNHRFEQTTLAPRPSSSDDSSLSLSLSSLPTSFLSSSSSSSLSSSCTPTSTHPPHPLPASLSLSSLLLSTQLPLSLSSRSVPTFSTPTKTTNALNRSNTSPIPAISGSTIPKMMIMTPPTSAHTHTHAHSQESSQQRQHRPAAVVACTVECWTTMIQLQEQLERLAQSLVSVLDSNYGGSSLRLGGAEQREHEVEEEVGRRKTSELRAMAMAALETCAGISSSSSSSSFTTTATTITTLTPRSSQHSTKDTAGHDDDGISGGNNRYGLLTPEVTPFSTPVITATIHHHHQQQPVSPRGRLHSVSSVSSSRTFTCSSGGGGSDQGGGSESGGITSLSALTLPGTIISDLEQQEQHQLQERNNTRDDGDNGSNDPQLLQGAVSHFSCYRMSFPPLLSNSSTPSSSSTAATPHNNTPTSTPTASSPATRTIRASQAMPPFITATTTPTTTTMRSSSGKKSRNPFLAMFGRTSSSTNSTAPSPSPSSSPLQGPISLGGVTQVCSQHPPSPKEHKSSSGGSSSGSRSGRKKEGKKKSGDEGTASGGKKKRRSSWFKSVTTTTAAASTAAATTTVLRGRANTMVAALPSSSSGSHLNNHPGSPSSSSSAATVTASGPESSVSRVTTASAPGGTLTARRFSNPFQFNLRGPGSRRSTLPTANSTSTSTSRAPPPPSSSSSSSSSSSGQNGPSTASFPRHLHTQPTGSQSHPQYYYSAPAAAAAAGNPRQLGPSTRTATGSFFDSVSDDSDSDEEFPSQYQQRQQYQYQSQQAPPPNYYQQQRVQPQQQQSAAVSSRQYEQDRRYWSYDSDEDSDSSEEEEDSEDDSDEDSDEEDSDEGEEETSSSYRHRRQQQVVNQDTPEGYMNQFDDAPPPPSYHSLIRAEADAARSAALASLYARGRQQRQQQQHAHAHAQIHAHTHSSPAAYPPSSAMMPSTLLTGLYAPTSTSSSSSSSSSIVTPTAQTSTPPAPSSQVSPTVLANLRTLLHTFESHLLAHHKTPFFQAQQSSASTMSRRQAWLDRNPQTVASFAYLLIELQQTGILPTAMSPSWSSASPSSSPPSPSSPVSASLALEMSEQDWLSMTGNAATEADLAKALLALEQNCLLAMDPVLWHRDGEERRDAWMRQVQAIITSSSN